MFYCKILCNISVVQYIHNMPHSTYLEFVKLCVTRVNMHMVVIITQWLTGLSGNITRDSVGTVRIRRNGEKTRTSNCNCGSWIIIQHCSTNLIKIITREEKMNIP